MAMSMTQAAPVLFGEGVVSLLGERIKMMGCKKVLCVTDKGVQGAGILDKVTDSLKAAGLDYVCFDDCKTDTPDAIVDTVAEIARREAIDCMVGVGGGSSLDAAKAASVLIKDNVSVTSLFGAPPRTPDVPLILLPTTAGTGSEVTMVSVVSDTKNNLKQGLIVTGVRLAMVDPELTVGVPPAITAMTGMDVVAHAAEALTGAMKNPLSDIRAIDALKRVAKYLPAAVENGKNMEARSNMCLASNFAGMAFNDAMVSFGHALAHALGAIYHLPHGFLCALATPPVMECFSSAVPDSVRVVGEALGADIPADASAAEIGRSTADCIRALMRKIGIQSLKEKGYTREDFISKADKVMAEGTMFFSPLPMTKELVEAALASMHDNYL